MLPEKCPQCGGVKTVRAETTDYGTPQERRVLKCRCGYEQSAQE